MWISYSNDVVLSPENLRLFGFHQTRTLIHQWKMQNHEIIVVVNVYFRSLNEAGAVVNVQRVKMKVIFQEIQILNCGIGDMVPFQRSKINGINHYNLLSLYGRKNEFLHSWLVFKFLTCKNKKNTWNCAGKLYKKSLRFWAVNFSLQNPSS